MKVYKRYLNLVKQYPRHLVLYAVTISAVVLLLPWCSKGGLFHKSRLQDYEYVIRPRVTTMVLCSRFQCLCIPTGFFTQISNLFFSFKALEGENWISKWATFTPFHFSKSWPSKILWRCRENFSLHISPLVNALLPTFITLQCAFLDNSVLSILLRKVFTQNNTRYFCKFPDLYLSP